MKTQPAFDFSILVPISLAGLSIVGIVVVLIIGRNLSSPPPVPRTPSPTPFQYLYLGTEPAVLTPLTEGSQLAPTEDPFGEPTQGPPAGGTATPTSPVLPTPVILTAPNTTRTPTSGTQQTNTPPPTATSASGPPLNPGTYDDVDSRLIYNGWNSTSSGSTLHVSIAPGSTISFRFIGTQVRLLYQGGSTLGQLSVTIDNQTFTLSQSSGTEWASTQLVNGTHTVLITHTGGGSVNLDQVIIPDPATPTPTRTPTQS